MGKYIDQISTEIKEAMKAKDSLKLEVLRAVKTAINNLAIQKGKNDLNDQEELDVITKQAKQRRESYQSYVDAGRNELAEKEQSELSILETYLPEQMDDAAIRTIAEETIKEVGATEPKDMGLVMKSIMPKVQGQADGKVVQGIIRELLS